MPGSWARAVITCKSYPEPEPSKIFRPYIPRFFENHPSLWKHLTIMKHWGEKNKEYELIHGEHLDAFEALQNETPPPPPPDQENLSSEHRNARDKKQANTLASLFSSNIDWMFYWRAFRGRHLAANHHLSSQRRYWASAGDWREGLHVSARRDSAAVAVISMWRRDVKAKKWYSNSVLNICLNVKGKEGSSNTVYETSDYTK